ncbi:hypothetical protein AB0C96_34305 [Streptomyces sp. NPDC048506]|uniref:hypothetical protein n=1 Tax=Streptomyces sp. NPDC048506 TaxID=3155028 RepID=UPI00341A1A6C
MIELHPLAAGAPLGDLAHRLRAADTAGWSEDGARALVESLGLGREAFLGGTSAGGLRLRPVSPAEQRYATQEAYLELAVTVATAEPDAASQAQAFRAANDDLTAALGEASVMGSYGPLGPYYGSTPAWGAPFLRWRGTADTLELRAGPHGPELVLQPTAPMENWFSGLGHGEEHAITGFFGRRPGPSNAGLGLPARWSARSWDAVTASLADFFATLPAEFAALGIAKIIRLYGRLGGGAPALLDIDADSRLMLGSFADDDIDPASFGWGTIAEHPRTRDTWGDDYDPRWRYDAGGPGEPSGRALAEMVVASARAEGVADPGDLLIGGEGEDIGPYRVTFYGLGLPTV